MEKCGPEQGRGTVECDPGIGAPLQTPLSGRLRHPDCRQRADGLCHGTALVRHVGNVIDHRSGHVVRRSGLLRLYGDG